MASNRNIWAAIAAIIIVVIIIAAVVFVAYKPSSNTNSTINKGTSPSEMVTYASDWPMPNKDYSNTRATTSSLINSGNVNTLGLGWSYKIEGYGLAGGGTSNPIIQGNTVYFQDDKCNIFAFDFSTGNLKWAKYYNASAIVGPVGPVVGYGKVFAMKDLYNVTALNSSTGNELWTTRMTNILTSGIDIAPSVYDGKVYVSTVPGTGDVFYSAGGIGVLYALDQQTGAILWNQTTVKDNDLWGHPEINSGGGCWYPPAIDTNTGYMYWGIGNPAPFPGKDGYPSGSSFDTALYTDSVMALDHNNGDLRWSSQAIMHDIWDHDLQLSPILASVNIGKIQQDVVISSGKAGEVFCMNRTTGAILWSVLVGDHQNDTIDPITKTMWIEPGALGGVETPMAYSDGMVYVPVVNWPMLFNTTHIIGSKPVSGDLVAIDARYGHIVWDAKLPSVNFGAATVVNDLVFTATYDGTIYAFNKATGAMLWTYKAPAGINGWPAVKGDTIIWPAGTGGVPTLIALKLGGTLPPTISITSPQNGASISNSSLTVSVSVQHFQLVANYGGANVAGQGHIHYFLDVDAPTKPGVPAVPTSGRWINTADTSYTFTNVTSGEHKLSVELVNNDHTPLAPPVVATIKVTVAATGPPEVTTYAKDWPMANKDYSNSRATFDSTIDSGNVAKLNVSWSFKFPSGGAFGSASSNPLILGDTVFFQDLYSNVYAVNLTTGVQKWAKINNQTMDGPNGPAVGYGMVFAQSDQYNLTALNINTGQEVWRTKLSNIRSTGADIAALVYDNMVYTSTVPGAGDVFYAPGGMGILYGLVAQNGSMVWSFNTVKDGNLWGHPEVNSGGGAWYTPAVDTDTGTMYWGIGNPAPFPGTAEWPSGSSFDTALYTDSMLAINHTTGQLEWYTQAVHHDIWDHDLQISPILAYGNVAGVQQDIVIGSGKAGKVFAFNADTGAIQWVTPVGIHMNDDVDPIVGQMTVYPGILGGIETPMAYAGGIVYVPVVNMPQVVTPTGLNFSGSFDLAAATGELVAINITTGHILWDKTFTSMNVGAATVVNDLVFTATLDGMIYAFDRFTGDQMFQYQAPAGINAWPAVAGDTIVWPCGIGANSSLLALSLPKTPVITIVSPPDNANVTGPNVTISVQVANFQLVANYGGTNVPGQGHIHYFMDVQAPTTPGVPAVPTTGRWINTIATSYTWTNVTPGRHNFSVELVNNDHTPLVPPVVMEINLTVTSAAVAPSLIITSPAEGATITGTSVTIDVNVQNFQLVANYGGANVAGQGHIHYFMDVKAPTTPGVPAIPTTGQWINTINTSYTWTGVTPGLHNFSAELVNNDHTPLIPPVVMEINVTVGSAAAPSLVITSPTEGATITGTSVTVDVVVQNFQLVANYGGTNVAGQGHIHYFMDVKAPTTPGVPAIPTTGQWINTINTSYTWTNVAPGHHNFSAELVNNDHTPLVPPVVYEVNVTVSQAVTHVDIYLQAMNIAFNMSTITVPAGAQVTVHFSNMDSGIFHNFAVYTDSSATTSIFTGTPIQGVASTTYTFTAPSTPGTYFFRCDIHPTLMTGSFVVT